MMDAVYFGTRPKPSLTRLLEKAGYRIIYAQYKKGVLASLSDCAAVVLHWKAKKDQQVIREAKAAGVPVMVITSRLTAAYTAGTPLADLYLEEPALDEDVAGLLIDLVDTGDTIVAATTSNRRQMRLAA